MSKIVSKIRENKKIVLTVGIFLLLMIVLVIFIHQKYKSQSGIIAPENPKVVVTTTGPYSIILENFTSVHNENEEDTTPPILIAPGYSTVLVGSTKIPAPTYCIDNIDRNVECEIVGEYNLLKVGEYHLERVARDKAGNETRKPFVLKVVKKFKKGARTESTLSEKHQIADIISMYKNEETRIGIDVSKWQGDNIDWNKVKDSGVEFVYMRLGIQNGFGGAETLDKTFISNFKGAKAAGLEVGVYYYSYARNIYEALGNAKFVIKTLEENNFVPDLPVAFDWESWSKLSAAGMSLNDLNDSAKIFIDTMREFGYDGTLYSSKYYLENGFWYLPEEYTVWLAHYTSQTSYEGSYWLWQRSCTGRVPGINGDVDIDIMKKQS
ncbi:MAG: hypothetical protein GX241_00690 [Ruminococcaceae bacterium]|nr:hypothetical protein [Oscillospiraceae bacterium]